MRICIDLPNETATAALAGRIGALLTVGDTVLLEGPLGVGKSAFVRSALRFLADDPELEVPSPTFTLVQPYPLNPVPIAHFDLYRLGDPDELLELGLDEALADGAAFIEWPERLGPYRPPTALTLTLSLGTDANSRVAQIRAKGLWIDRLTDAGFTPLQDAG